MDQFIVKNRKFFIGAIIFLAVIFIFSGLTRADIQSDDATYSYRSVGYVDYMNNSNRQTTPLQWFEEYPGWARLSFHDHPPLVFIIQHVFFVLFGSSSLVAKLPFAIAGVLSVVVLYFLARELYNEKVALLASFILTVLSYFSWASKIGFLEPVVTLMLLLATWMFFKGIKDSQYFIGFGVFLGLAMLSKYTAIFIVPTLLIYLLLQNREVLSSKHFLLSIAVSLVIFFPVIVYNIIMFKERGHFDLQLALLFGQDLSDWSGISRSVGGFDLIGIFKLMFDSMSIFVFGLLLISMAYVIYSFVRNIKAKTNLFLILFLLFSFAFFAFIDPELRMLSVLLPFLALIMAVFIFNLAKLVISSEWNKYLKYIVAALVIFIFSFEGLYNINTNLLPLAFGQEGRLYSKYRLPTGGFNDLEEYFFENNIVSSDYRPQKIKTYYDILTDATKVTGKDIVVYDPDLNWFSTTWYFSRHSIYNKDLFLSAADLGSQISPDNWMDFFVSSGIRNFYFIKGEGDAVFGSSQNRRVIYELARTYEEMNAEEADIYNSNNELMFKVYKIKIN